MNGRRRSLQVGLTILMAIFLFCTPALAGGFADVSGDHWAVKYVNKMSAMGIISGYGDGTFRPNKEVTQLEATVMAVRCTGREASGSVDVPFSVPAWGKQDVARALDTGLIKSSEDFSADKAASRAWVTRMLVRAAGLEGEARRAEVQPNFTDSYKIPGWAEGYVKVAQDENLVGGYSDGTFRPEQEVTRAELAALLERALDYIEEPAGAITGEVVEASAGQATVRAGDRDYPVDGDVPVYDEDGSISISDLQRYDRVLLIAEGDAVQYLEKLPGESASKVVSGEIVTVYPEQGTVVVETPGGQLENLYLPENAGVTVDGSDDQGLAALKKGDAVEVTLNNSGYIAGITVKGRSLDKENEGIIYEVDAENDLITIQGESGHLASYRLGEQVLVQLEEHRFPSLDDLRAGDRVRLGIESSAVTEVEVLEVSSRLEVAAEVISVSPGEKVITLRTGKDFRVFPVAGDAEITAGGEDLDLDDLHPGDEVKVKVDKGEVTSLVVEGSGDENRFNATVQAVDRDNDSVVLRDEQEDLKLYELRDNARIRVDGDEANLRDLEKDMDVSVRLIDGEIAYLEVDNSVQGTVDEIDADGLLLVLEDENGNTDSYVLEEDVDVDSEDSRNDLDDIDRGDYAELEIDDGEVVNIDLETQMVLRVDRAREAYDRIYAEDEDGDRETLRIENAVDLVGPGGDSLDIDDFEEGDMVRATYTGRDLDRVELLEPRYGEISSVSSYNDIITVAYFGGGSEEYNFDGDGKVIIDDDEYHSLSRIASGDRVEVLENREGGYDFRVMERLSGTLAYAPDDDEVYLDDDQMGWDDYDLHRDVYVHDGYGGLSLDDLEKGDSVRLYMLNDKVYEIELR